MRRSSSASQLGHMKLEDSYEKYFDVFRSISLKNKMLWMCIIQMHFYVTLINAFLAGKVPLTPKKDINL